MALQAMDDVIASLLDGIHAEGLSSCINMILLADHGKGRSCVYVWYSKLYICFLEMLTYRQKLLTINTTCVHVHVHVNVLFFVL